MYRLILIIFLAMISFAAVAEDDAEQKKFRSLNQQVQALKQSVIGLEKEISQIEDVVLHPDNVQLTVFLSMDVGNFFSLSSVDLSLDDRLVASHIYTEREKDALKRGAVQRIFHGNVAEGSHKIIATFSGQGPRDREYRRAVTKQITKNGDAAYVELRIYDAEKKQQPDFQVKQW